MYPCRIKACNCKSVFDHQVKSVFDHKVKEINAYKINEDRNSPRYIHTIILLTVPSGNTEADGNLEKARDTSESQETNLMMGDPTLIL